MIKDKTYVLTKQGDKMRKYISMVFKTISFLIIGIFLFAIIQNILMPKRAPYTKAYDAGKLAGFYNNFSESQ